MLLRLFFFAVLFFLLLLVVKTYLSRSRRGRRMVPPGEDMALDPQCQSYVPKSAALQIGGNFFCSRECAERYLAR